MYILVLLAYDVCVCWCSVDAMSVMNEMVESKNIEVLQLMNTSSTHNVSSDQLDTSLVSTTTVPQTGMLIHL